MKKKIEVGLVLVGWLLSHMSAPKPPVRHYVTVAWMRSTTKTVTGYYIYRDGTKVTTLVRALTYRDQNPPAGMHVYTITAFNGTESVPSNPAPVYVP